MLRFKLLRLTRNDKQTLGNLFVYEKQNKIKEYCTLELTWNNNERNTSCIPAGKYFVEKYNSPTKGLVFLIKDVPDRDYIEIHVANFNMDIKGCIAVGIKFTDHRY